MIHSKAILEKVVYDLQSDGKIIDPCVVDDLITAIKGADE
jgi:hypothetical protein|tara:strand:+ start:708 stop:827 length:120 start_codon:yes stop_codon:yes gene_type:complete